MWALEGQLNVKHAIHHFQGSLRKLQMAMVLAVVLKIQLNKKIIK